MTPASDLDTNQTPDPESLARRSSRGSSSSLGPPCTIAKPDILERVTCGKGCKLFLVLLVTLLALVWLLYEPNLVSANMCHVYG